MKKTLIAWFTLIALLEGILYLYGQGIGFKLRGDLTFGGFSAGEPVWVIGKGVRIIAVDPVLHHHLKAMEGKRIQFTVGLPE